MISGFTAVVAQDPALKRRVGWILGLLAALNFGAWGAAFAVFGDRPLLLGTCLIAYTFGLRHAVDADHIAAIDNVTRKLMQDGRKPLGVGLYFSLGHSTVVIAATLGIVLTAGLFAGRLARFAALGSVVGTSVSAVFLLVIAAINFSILVDVVRMFQAVRRGAYHDDHGLDGLMARRGFFNRLCRPIFRLIDRSWQMYPLGFLFGLGFDTATEIGLLGLSGAAASKGMSIWAILVFPALFTAGMALIDTLDGILMLGAYGWAFVHPIRKLYYNMTITLTSVAIALLVGGIEALGLLSTEMGLRGPFWSGVAGLNDRFGTIGYVIIGVFLASWIVSSAVYKWAGYDRLALPREPAPTGC